MPGSIRALLDLELLKEAEHKLGGRATRAMAATRPDGPAARALGEIDAAPAARVMGLAVRVLLELSGARGTADMAAPDVTPLVSGAGALLPLGLIASSMRSAPSAMAKLDLSGYAPSFQRTRCQRIHTVSAPES